MLRQRNKICFLSGELESYIDNTFPIDRMTRCIGGGLKAGGLHGVDGRVAKAVAEIAGDAENLDSTRGRDTEPNRDDAFNVKVASFCGVLWLGFEQNLRSRFSRCCRRTSGLRQGWGSVLAEVYSTGSAPRSIQRPGATGDSKLDSNDAGRGVISSVHVLAAG